VWRSLVLLISLAQFVCAAKDATPRYTGPWDLAELRRAPAVTWLKDTGTLRSLTYPGEPLHGKPTRVFAYYAVPAERDGKVPAMVLVHGGGGKAFAQWAALWAKRGYAALAMDLAGHGPDGKRLPDGGPDQGHRDKFLTLPDGLRNTWPYHAVAAVIRGASVLAAQPEVDAERMGITGISWGGYLTCIVAGLDDRLKVAIPVYGCGFLHENSARGWLHILNEKLPPEQRRAWVANFDPSRYLAQATMPMLWVNGTNDFAYPLDSYQKSYRLPTGPRTLCVTVRMPHGHQAGWTPVEIGLFADQHLRGGTPLPARGPMTVQGKSVSAPVRSETDITRAQLHYTTETVTWNQRTWHSTAAQVKEGVVRATLSADDASACFLTVTDSRGATVSTEHAALR
jgi:dienelactone hydrolase